MLQREKLLAGRSLVRGTYSTVEDCRYEFIYLFRRIPGPSAGSACTLQLFAINRCWSARIKKSIKMSVRRNGGGARSLITKRAELAAALAEFNVRYHRCTRFSLHTCTYIAQAPVHRLTPLHPHHPHHARQHTLAYVIYRRFAMSLSP